MENVTLVVGSTKDYQKFIASSVTNKKYYKHVINKRDAMGIIARDVLLVSCQYDMQYGEIFNFCLTRVRD